MASDQRVMEFAGSRLAKRPVRLYKWDEGAMKATKLILATGIFTAAIFGLPGVVRAQAAPGPIHPAQSPDDSSAGAPPAAAQPKAPDVPQKRDLTGSWKLNEDQSDDPSEKMKQAQQAGAGNRGGGGNRGVWNGGGGGYPGGGGGYPGGGGGGGGYGGRRGMGTSESESDREKIQDAVNPANQLAFKQNDAEIDMSDDQGRRRVFYTDGRKIEKPKKDKDKDKSDDYKELAAHWEGMKLQSEEKGPHGKITRLFEVPAGGQQLRETVHFDDARGNPVTIHYVYDIVKAEKKDGTSSTTITSN
jgi:hypothetical protein